MRKKYLLVVTAILALAGILYSIKFFDKAFPIVNVQITADKHEVVRKADSLTQACAFMDTSYRSVAAFDTDERFKNYVELEGEGVEAFQEIVDSEIYHPYTWSVRIFNTDEIEEVTYTFSPAGEFLGFRKLLPDSLEGKNIPGFDIKNMFLRSDARSALLPDISEYELVEESSELKEGGRRDHVFTFERKDIKVGEAHYRIKVGVSGDDLTMVHRYVKIPEGFDNRYEEMRSANTTISFIGQAVMIILYGFIGVGVSIFFMMRRKILLWRAPMKWAVVIGTLIFFAYLTTISLSWFNYDTSLSANQFIFQQVMMALVNGLLIAVIFFISAVAGEGLDRQAFPGHIRLWRSWSPTVGASREIMSNTVLGYLWAFFMIGFITFFYWISNNIFGWWSPAENMVDPNVLALPLPWLLPAAQSLQAGFWEECLFRAVPLAGAVLIGKNFKRKGLWIAVALVFQAVVFGALHANYAQQPAYARIIEMLIPFILYGLIYINWGLLPVVISHFVYDIVLMAMPLFILSAPGIWIHRVGAVIAALIPLLIVAYRRLRAGKWYTIKAEDLNSGFVAPKKEKKEEPAAEEEKKALNKQEGKSLGSHYRTYPVFLALVIMVLSAAAWIALTPFEQDVPKLKIDRHKAILIADSFMERRYPGMDSLNVKPYVRLDAKLRSEDRFVWENTDQEAFRELYENTLSSNYFVVTYKTFEGDVETRSETLRIMIGRDGEILGWNHHVPDSRAGDELTEDEARTIAEKSIEGQFSLSMDELIPVKVVPEKLNDRKDWQFIYRKTQEDLDEGFIRYTANIAGSELSALRSDVHITESWEREQKKENTKQFILSAISNVIQFGLLITVIIMGIIAWTHKRFHVRIFLWFLAGLFLLSLLQTLLLSNALFAQYPTSEPLNNLLIIFIISAVIGSIFSAFLYAIPAGYMAHLPLPVYRNEEQVWIKGISLGLLFAAFLAFVNSGIFKDVPQRISPAEIDSLLPALSSLFGAAETYLMMLIRLLVPFVLVQRLSPAWRKNKIQALVILFVSGFMFIGKLPLQWWLLNGAIFGMLMIGLYLLIMRYNMIYVPVMAAVVILLDILRYALTDPAVFTAGHVIITAVVTIFLALLSIEGMHKIRLLQPQ